MTDRPKLTMKLDNGNEVVIRPTTPGRYSAKLNGGAILRALSADDVVIWLTRLRKITCIIENWTAL